MPKPWTTSRLAQLGRIDKKAGRSTFNEQRQYIGQEYDADTGLNYLNARYYNATLARFTIEDPVFLAMGDNNQVKQLTGQNLQQVLADPQNLNSYAYSRNNPITGSDPNGLFDWRTAYNPFTWPSETAQIRMGNAANNLYQSNSIARYALDHPYQSGAIIGIGVGLAIVGGIAEAGGVITCGVLCNAFLQKESSDIAQVLSTNKVNNISSGASELNNLPIRSTAIPKLNALSEQFGMSKAEILKQASQSTMKYVDNLPENAGNINIWIPKPSGAEGFIRVTTNPELNAVISAGQNGLKQVVNGIASGRFTPLK